MVRQQPPKLSDPGSSPGGCADIPPKHTAWNRPSVRVSWSISESGFIVSDIFIYGELLYSWKSITFKELDDFVEVNNTTRIIVIVLTDNNRLLYTSDSIPF